MNNEMAATAGTVRLGDRTVNRLGYGAMRITGEGVWGPPRDHDEAIRVLRRAVDLGVNFIDTADSYGPGVSEELIAEALHPYPDDLVIATKAGLVRPGPGRWDPDGRPGHIREAVEASLRRLRVDRIDLYQSHRPDPGVPYEETIGAFKELQDAGKVANVGVSNVGRTDLARARAIVEVVSVQNRYNLSDRSSEQVLEVCEAAGIAFIPWFPLATGQLAGSALERLAQRKGITPMQAGLAWILHRATVMLPIPGTSSVKHLEENLEAARVTLSDEEMGELEQG
ncbi:MAG: pyridoxine 4-dehydrogenase [Chloroflexota bacterium]|jgi:aryl-alcohol dehydrogenase-like predicted oxidoreductase|nr:pyridoxine 4-dehydrogenase [Chloroflexota bacterium]